MHALKVLEFEAVRQGLQSHCETTLAVEAASDLMPSFERDEVWRLLAETREAYDLIAKHPVPSLGPVRDLRSAAKRAQKGGVLGSLELFQIGEALSSMRQMKSFLDPRRDEAPSLWNYVQFVPDARKVEDAIFEALEPNGDVKDHASTELAGLRSRKKSVNAKIIETIQRYTTGSRRDLLSDPIYTVRDGRYVIPLKAENRGKIKGIVHDTSGSGQTVYLEPEDVLQLGNQLREIESREREEIQRILTSLSSRVGGVAGETINGIEQTAKVDLALAKAKLGFAMKGTMPQPVASGHMIRVQGARHPLLDPQIAVPLELEVGRTSVLITGPNTGGKTVAMKTIGLFVLMAQSGLLVPALDVRLGPFTQVWADIGDEQSLQQSLSTFSGHIKNISEAIKNLKPGALVLLDEVGAGTDPAEGAALARGILTTLRDRGATILASTHYGELKAFAYNTEGFQNAAMEFDQKTLRPTYRLILGAPGASHALKIAERYGIPTEVVELARSGLTEQQQDVARMLERLEQAQKQARIAQGEADRRLAELRKAEQGADRKLKEAEEIRQKVHGRASQAIEDALREIRLEATEIFEEVKRAGADPKALEKARQKLKDLNAVGGEFAQELAPKAPKKAPAQVEMKAGDSVRIEGYTQVGTLLEDPRDGKALVQMGPLKMTVPVAKLNPVQEKAKPEVKPRVNIGLQKAQTAVSEIHLRAMRAEDAQQELERFIDDAVLAGLPSVRIVHGKGEGILRKITQDYLRRHPHVSNFREAGPAEGGAGVTVAVIR